MSTYSARRVASRFYEMIGADEFTPGDDFNIDTMPYAVDDETLTFDTMADLIDAVRRDYVTFDATGADWASDPDGSQIIDYATGARETVSWHFNTIGSAMLTRVIMPAIDGH